MNLGKLFQVMNWTQLIRHSFRSMVVTPFHLVYRIIMVGGSIRIVPLLKLSPKNYSLKVKQSENPYVMNLISVEAVL